MHLKKFLNKRRNRTIFKISSLLLLMFIVNHQLYDNIFSKTVIAPELKDKLMQVHRNNHKMAKSDEQAIQQLVTKIGTDKNVLQIPYENGEISNLSDLDRLVQHFCAY